MNVLFLGEEGSDAHRATSRSSVRNKVFLGEKQIFRLNHVLSLLKGGSKRKGQKEKSR